MSGVRRLMGALMVAVALVSAGPVAALEMAPGLELEVIDGQSRMAPMDLRPSATGGTARDLTVTIGRPDPSDRIERWRVTCTDLAGKARWLELRVSDHVAIEGAPRYWPGFQQVDLAEEPYEGSRTGSPAMPLAAAWGDGGGRALGLEPHERVSWLEHAAEAGEGQVRMTLKVRIVLDPGDAKTLQFVRYDVGGWGMYEALDRYYDLAPEYYEVRRNVDPRINMPSAQYAAWSARGSGEDTWPWWEEVCRRNFAGWDWCYAPFKRTGDIFGRTEDWEAPMQPGREDVKQRMHLDDIDAFRRWRQEAFAGGERGGVAMLFYVPAMVWCEESLAREKFADSLTQDPKRRSRIERWVTGWDTCLRVLPSGTSYEDRAKLDLIAVARELDLSGFAFDTATGDARHFGPAAQRFASRAWEPDEGEFVREGIAIAEIIDYCRSMVNSRGDHLGVVSNLGFGWYTVCQATDAALREANPWQNERAYNDVSRYFLGRKPACWWEGYDLHNILAYEEMTPKQLAEAYLGLSDFVISESYRWGFLPTATFTRGIAPAIAQLPTLVECIHAGWEPVPAATADGASFVTRYGERWQTRLALGNESAEPATSGVTTDAQWLGRGWLFSMADGAAVRNEFLTDGATRVAGIAHAPREVAVLRAQARITPAPEGAALTVEVHDEVATRTVTLTMDEPLAEAADLRVALPQGWAVAEARIDGGPAGVPREADHATVQLDVPAGARKVQVAMASELFASDRRALQGFPLADDGAEPATIVLRPGASEQERIAAERIARMVASYYACALDAPREVTLPIAEADAPATGPIVVIDGSGGAFAESIVGRREMLRGASAVGVCDRALVIVARDGARALQVTERLLRVLDEQYPWPGYMVGLTPNSAVGVVGKYIGADGRWHGTSPLG